MPASLLLKKVDFEILFFIGLYSYRFLSTDYKHHPISFGVLWLFSFIFACILIFLLISSLSIGYLGMPFNIYMFGNFLNFFYY